jgi:hypothetical protein
MAVPAPELKSKLLHAGRRVRRWAELARTKRNIRRWDSDLFGACATASTRLLIYLRRRGIKATVHMNDGHCFIKAGGYILDVTATQFDEMSPKVLLTRHSTRWYHETRWIFRTPAGLYANLRKEGWGNCLHDNRKLLGDFAWHKQSLGQPQ